MLAGERTVDLDRLFGPGTPSSPQRSANDAAGDRELV
jgi:hypothetical protein